MDRRRFFKVVTGVLAGFWAVAVVYPISRFLNRPPDPEEVVTEVAVAKVAELSPGQSVSFRFGKRPGLLICESEGQYKAFDATCSHLACTAQFRSDKKDIFCACHGGVYDLDGKNVSGPPPRPLESFQVNVKGEDIIVSKA